jgi:hypothetical protein
LEAERAAQRAARVARLQELKTQLEANYQQSSALWQRHSSMEWVDYQTEKARIEAARWQLLQEQRRLNGYVPPDSGLQSPAPWDDPIVLLVTLGAAGFLRPAGAATATGRGVWDLLPFQRGVAIERQLGHNLPGNFPVIDRFQNGVATSIKSMDLAAGSYQSAATISRVGQGYVNAVARFQGRTWAGVTIRPADITARGLDLAVPAGATQAQQQALDALVSYGARNGVIVRISVVR